MKTLSVSQMAAHVYAVAKQNNIDVILRTTYRGRALPNGYAHEDLPGAMNAAIHVPEIKSAVTYALALHELGHLLGRKPSTRLEKEVAAWKWARVQALVWTDPMHRKMQRCLLSYRRWANRRRSVVRECSALDAMLAGK